MKKWTIEDSKELYNINGWGTSYFGINEEGNVFVTPWSYCDSPISSTTASRRRGAVSRRPRRSTTTRARTMWSIPLR